MFTDMTENQIKSLRTEYAKMKRVDPMNPTMEKLRELIAGLPQDELTHLSTLKIKWLSSMAATQIILREIG